MTVSELQINLKELKELKLVGFRVLCPTDQYLIEIPKTSLQLSKRISEIKHVETLHSKLELLS